MGTPRAARYRDAGVRAARWIESVAERSGDEAWWPPKPGQPDPAETSLYSGVPGGVLLLLDAHRACGDPALLDLAAAAGRWVRRRLPGMDVAGLLTGAAGVGFVLHELDAVLPGGEFADAADEAVARVLALAERDPAGVHWGGASDILFGSAGVALWLLQRRGGPREEAVDEVLRAAGSWLVAHGRPTPADGLKWDLGPAFVRAQGELLMPNFSHGTAGIAYALARLSGPCTRPDFLDAALAGARYLISVARTDDGGCAVFHHEPGGEDVHVLGWCHGSTGLAWLFRGLEEVTGDPTWREWTLRCARTVRTSGIPRRIEPGFWDNVARCCGSTSVAELFLDLHLLTGEDDFLDFSLVMSDDVLSRAIDDDSGMRWSNVEFRVDPPDLPPETGYMQGAAGIGCWLLRLARALEGDSSNRAWPHSPF